MNGSIVGIFGRVKKRTSKSSTKKGQVSVARFVLLLGVFGRVENGVGF